MVSIVGQLVKVKIICYTVTVGCFMSDVIIFRLLKYSIGNAINVYKLLSEDSRYYRC